MNKLVKAFFFLLAVTLLPCGCSEQNENKNQEAKEILSKHAADMVEPSLLDHNPDSTRFLATSAALTELLALGQPLEDEPWKSLLTSHDLSVIALTELPWANRDLRVNSNFEFYVTRVPSELRGNAMNILDAQLPEIAFDPKGNLTQITNLQPFERLRDLAAAAGADFVESTINFDDIGMIAADNRIANLRDAIAKKPFVNAVSLALDCEMMRMKLWGWAATQGLLSEKILEEKPYAKRLPDYRKLLRHAFLYELLQCELITQAYANDPKGTAKLFAPGVLKRLPGNLQIAKDLYPAFIDQRLQLANILNVLTDPEKSTKQVIAAKAYLSEMKQNPLFVRLKNPPNTFTTISSKIDADENAAKLLSTAFAIARYRNSKGILPEKLSQLHPDYCITLPESAEGKLQEWLPVSEPAGQQAFKLFYPPENNNLSISFDSGKQQ